MHVGRCHRAVGPLWGQNFPRSRDFYIESRDFDFELFMTSWSTIQGKLLHKSRDILSNVVQLCYEMLFCVIPLM